MSAPLRDQVIASRIAQGLPPHIDDPVALARIANLLKMPRASWRAGSVEAAREEQTNRRTVTRRG